MSVMERIRGAVVWFQSLEAMLEALRSAGYDLGPELGPEGAPIDGEAIVRALQAQEEQRGILVGARGICALCASCSAHHCASHSCTASRPARLC